MRTELTFARATSMPQPANRPLPFLLRRLAGCKPNRLAASIRIPVTLANRALLRNLRAAEMAAWEKALRPGTRSECVQVEEAL